MPFEKLCHTLLALFWLLNAPLLCAQTAFEQQTDIPLQAYGDTLRFAWIGGLNNPQFSEADLNNDQIADLFVFDRSGNHLIALINGGTPNTVDYTLSLTATQHFPLLEDWALLRDYDCDGIADLFTSTNGDAIRLYRGAWNTNNQLTFTLATDKLTANDTAIFTALYDIPAVDDIDNDGDLDILTFAQNGGHVIWYRNMAAENGNACAIPSFVNADACWGDFYESGITTSLDLDAPCTPSPPPMPPAIGGITTDDQEALKSARHPGSTLFTTDLDGNGTTDLVLGDISFDNLVATFNDGTPDNAHVSVQDTLFPAYNTSAHLYIFPAAFEADIDNNGTKDMLVAPNAKVQSQHYRCVWLYRNSQTVGTQYSYETDTFLVRDMIDVNRRAAPALFDHNSDGLLDIVIGNYGYMNDAEEFEAALALYENIGTLTAPSFRLVTNNYADVNAQFAIPRLSLKPAFGDLDGDGDADMLIGDVDGYFHYFENQPIGGIAHFVLMGEQYQGLDIAQNVSPQLIDVDGDGLLDLLAGHHNGIIQYRRNMGTATAPLFNTNTNSIFGGVDVRKLGSPTGHATPFLTTFNGERVLIVGSESGLLHLYHNIDGNINTGGIFTELTLPTIGITQLDGTTSLNLGEFSKPVAADIDNDGRLDILVGINQGGLVWLEAADTTVSIGNAALPPNNVALVSIHPNPSTDLVYVELSPLLLGAAPATNSLVDISVYDLSGKLQLYRRVAAASAATTAIALPVGTLPAGIYVLQIRSNAGSASAKLLKR